MTKARSYSSSLHTSQKCYIEEAVDNDKTKDTATELRNLGELKARRVIQRQQLGASGANRRERVKHSM